MTHAADHEPQAMGHEARAARSWLVPCGLFLLAAAVRLVVAALVPFLVTEGSAYYVGVARNLLEGDGLVTDALWSYATPPLSVPRPAFELWMPMTTFVTAAGMTVLGPTLWAAQVASCLVGALLAPLAWAVARAAAQATSLDRRRGGAVAFAAGLLVAMGSPFVLSAAVPDSYTPYAVASVAAALLVPRVATGERPSVLIRLALGAVLGLAYLARQEVVWLGVAVVVAAWVGARGPHGSDGPATPDQGTRRLGVVARLAPVVLGGLVVVVPWLVRELAAFGTPFPGQALENALLTRNEDIYAFLERPTLDSYLGQGLPTLLGNPLAAVWDALVNVLVLPAFPVGLVGLVAVVLMWRSHAFRVTSALGVLLLSGALTFVGTMLLFPVATRWGTFLHASGPLLVALTVAAVLGTDALLTRISAIRSWEKPNIIIGPIALLTIGVVMLGLQVVFLARQAQVLDARYETLRAGVAEVATAHGAMPGVVISDHPIWVAEAVGLPAVALPDEDLGSIVRLMRMFDTGWLVVMDRRGRYPGELLSGEGRACVTDEPKALGAGAELEDAQEGWIFVLDPACPASAEPGA